MKEISAEAQARFDAYLRDVHASLAGCTSIDTAEVGGDVRAHIQSAIEDLPEPVALGDLETVLESLGRPDQWVPEEEKPPLEGFAVQYREHPLDFQLGGTALAAMAFALVSISISLWAAVILQLFSFIVARLTLSTIEKRNEPIGLQKWFIYPPLLVGHVFLIALLLTSPLLLLGAI